MQFSRPEYDVFSISSYFFLIVLSLPSVRGDIEDEFIERTLKYQTVKNGIPHVWWPGSKIMTSRESKNVCNKIAKLTNTYLETSDEPTADKAFSDSVLVFFMNEKYANRIAEVLACEMGSSENYVREKWYIMLRDHPNIMTYCYFLLKQFREKIVFVDQIICIIVDNIEIEDRSETGSDSSVSVQGKNVAYNTNSDDVHSFNLTKYHQVEDEFVAYFGNGDTRVLWSVARNLHNLWELKLICHQLKRFQEVDVEEDELVVLVGNLLFLQTKYSKMPIDVISCGMTNAEDFPHHIYVTRGKFDDCYFLLDQSKQRNFFVSEHVCLSDSSDLNHEQYNHLEDEFVAHFENDVTPVVWSTIHNNSSNSQKLVDTCNRVNWIKSGSVIVSTVFVDTAELLFRNETYNHRQVDIIGCQIVGKHHVYITRGENDDCYYSLFRFQDNRFYIGRHFCEKLEF